MRVPMLGMQAPVDRVSSHVALVRNVLPTRLTNEWEEASADVWSRHDGVPGLCAYLRDMAQRKGIPGFPREILE